MNIEIPYGYCHCGCGEKTNLAKYGELGYARGEPFRYLVGHGLRGRRREQTNQWKGGRHACGHADWEQCEHCKIWGPPTEVIRKARNKYHVECRRRANRNRRLRRLVA